MPVTNLQVAENRVKLRTFLDENFSADDLRTLFFDLGVDYDLFDGETKQSKIIGLIQYFSRRNRLEELVEYSKHLRPDVNWVTFDEAAQVVINNQKPLIILDDTDTHRNSNVLQPKLKNQSVYIFVIILGLTTLLGSLANLLASNFSDNITLISTVLFGMILAMITLTVTIRNKSN